MKKLEKLKIVFGAILVTVVICFCQDHHYEYHAIEEIDSEYDDARCFRYSKGLVYITTSFNPADLEQAIGEDDIAVIDARRTIDPNVIVRNSYRITDIDIIDEILNIIMYIERNDPTEFNRTIESMRNEWEMHNYGYFLNYDVSRTQHVDLNNADEEKYNNPALTKLLRN